MPLTQEIQPEMSFSDALDKAREHSADGKTAKALSVIFDVVDDHFLAGDFQSIDDTLKDLDPETLDISTRIGVLTITLAAKHRLPSRPDFFDRVAKSLENETPERQQGLIGGLK